MTSSSRDSNAMTAFESYVLTRIAHNPTLISEVPATLQPSSTAATLTRTQRELLQLQQQHRAASSPLSSTADSYALMQRAVVDTPLLPLGVQQLLYEVLLPAFTAARDAAAAVYRTRVALEQHQQRDDKDATTTTTTSSSSSNNDDGNGSMAALQQRHTAAQEALRSARSDLQCAFARMRRVTKMLTSMHCAQKSNNNSKSDGNEACAVGDKNGGGDVVGRSDDDTTEQRKRRRSAADNDDDDTPATFS